MTVHQLHDAISLLPAEQLLETDRLRNPAAKRRSLHLLPPLAACLALLLGGGLFLHFASAPKSNTPCASAIYGMGQECAGAVEDASEALSRKMDQGGNLLTLDDVAALAQKGDALTWSDFAPYSGQEIGSGLYILRYEINDLFDVLIGGVPYTSPMYIRLRVHNQAEDYIDLRTGDVPAFILAHQQDTPVSTPAEAP